MENVRAEVDIEFDNTTTPGETIPSAEEVAATLREELANPYNTFSLTIDKDSIEGFVKNTATVAPTTAEAPTTPEALTTRRVTFRSAGEQFTADLLNSSSAGFISRASIIGITLEPRYRIAFTSFRTLTVVSFSNGSVFNNMDLGFVSSAVPNSSAIANVLVEAAPFITAFNIDISSIFVDGAQVSSGASHKMSLISASCLVVLSWLLANQE
ncbi:uncharacterized protein LOC133494724 [Syngnathoides biaculeatus]|uniref:uncharacterized protein LOC133494724 n=1 Tax=Syngnathoides biaculeatus TaxID=300417 RepID=UPI002ADE0419|nr:uncharacterized protein LOC133494724 [Syngnathoides biaculeatus]